MVIFLSVSLFKKNEGQLMNSIHLFTRQLPTAYRCFFTPQNERLDINRSLVVKTCLNKEPLTTMSIHAWLCINTKTNNTKAVHKSSKKHTGPTSLQFQTQDSEALQQLKVRMLPNQNVPVDHILTAQVFGCVFTEAYSTKLSDQLPGIRTTFYKQSI